MKPILRLIQAIPENDKVGCPAAIITRPGHYQIEPLGPATSGRYPITASWAALEALEAADNHVMVVARGTEEEVAEWLETIQKGGAE